MSKFDGLEIASHGLLIPVAATQVSPELGVNIEYLADVSHPQRFTLIECQILRRTHNVLDFSAVEVPLGQEVEVFLSKGLHLHLSVGSNTFDEHLEDGLLGLRVQSLVAKGNVNT
jgi:hypothetical protein